MPDPFVLALQASPRAGGNSDTVLEALLEPAARRGLRVERMRVASLGIRPCRGCHACEKTGACVQKDAMQQVYPRLLEAGWIVFATPIFFYNTPGDAKSLIDRCQALWARKYLPPGGGGPAPISAPGRRGFGLAVGATHGKNLFRGLRWTLHYFYDAVDVADEGLLAFRGLEFAGDAAKDPEVLRKAREAGERLFGA